MASEIQKSGLGIADFLKDQRSQILTIAQKHGACNVRVFGSVARGEATIDSDIDFLIDYDLGKITPWFTTIEALRAFRAGSRK
jgi:uncharacterized protein